MWKSNYILVEVVSQGFDIKRFLEALCAAKNGSPNIDNFSREQLKSITAKFKEDVQEGRMNDSASSDGGLDTSTGQLFDQAMSRPKKSSVLRRAQTKVAEDTILSQNWGATCIVTNID